VVRLNCFFLVAFAFLHVISASPCAAQQKYEREYSIKPSAVPVKAAEFVNTIFKGAKIHWYGEESLKSTTIEAKLKSSGKSYSIEFDESGKIQDVEILSSFKSIPAKTRDIMRENLDKEFKKFKVDKTQIQWTASESTLKKALLSDSVPASIRIRYEVIVKATKSKLSNYYEVLFEDNGTIVSVHEIVQRNSNNLIY